VLSIAPGGYALRRLHYLDRIAAFRTEPPPADWDGVFEHLVK